MGRRVAFGLICVGSFCAVSFGGEAGIRAQDDPDGGLTDAQLEQFAETEGIPLADAELAASHSGDLYDFVSRHEADDNFINVVATYDRVYRVKVVVNDAEAGRLLAAELSSILDLEVSSEVNSNGFSRTDALVVVTALDAVGLTFEYDGATGVVTVFTEGDDGAVATATTAVGVDFADQLVFGVEVPEYEGEEMATYPGDVVWASTSGVWSTPASVGVTWRGSPSGGGSDHVAFVSVAHLRNRSNNTWFWAGTYPGMGDPSAASNPKLLLEVCNGSNVAARGDYQYVRMDASLNQPETDDVGVPLWQAGGYYIGQLARVHGQHTNVVGSVRLYGIYPWPSANFSCYGTKWTVATTAKGIPGDSGGHMSLYYNSKWFFAGIFAGTIDLDATSPGHEGVSSPVWYMNLAPGYSNQRFCTQSNVCN